MSSDWYTLAEILPHAGAALPGSVGALADHAVRAGWRDSPRHYRLRAGRGGGLEYHVSLLPAEVRTRLALLVETVIERPPVTAVSLPGEGRSSALWAAFERLTESARAKAAERMKVVHAVESLSGMTRQAAVGQVAAQAGISPSSVWEWLGLVAGLPRGDRLPALAPRHAGRTVTSPCDPRAWDHYVANYLRPERRNHEACYRDLREAAAEHGWSPIPSAKTLQRRIEREFPAAVITLARRGADAAAACYPPQRRDRSIFAALQAVNADGHKADVMVQWEDGTVSRPMLAVFQDLASGVILSHRVDRSENKEVIRLAFADVVENWGVPEIAFLDNGRAFASKWMTGQMAHRFRFKVREEEPEGIFKALGVDVRWVTPYHGQAKPIERAFRDFCEDVSKHPAFAGAYTGNSTVNKPSNYGSKSVPIDTFKAVVAREIDRHNRREGRRTYVAKGRSFLAVYEASLAEASLPPRRATAAQRRMLLLAAEGVTARKPTGEIHLMGNRYWAEELLDRMGERLTVRFDPQNLTAPIAVYTTDNRFVCEAASLGDVAFIDETAARNHARLRKDFLRHTKGQLDAERRLTAQDVAAFMPQPDPITPPMPKVARLVANGGRVREAWDGGEDFGRGVSLLDGGVLPFVRKEEGGV